MGEPGLPLADLSSRLLAEVLSREPVVCSPGTSVQRAAELMARADTGSIVVLDADGSARGIVTDSDLRKRVVARALLPDTPVERVMSSPLLAVAPSTTFFEAVGLMLERHIHHLVVSDGERVLGVVADSDLVGMFGAGPLFLARRISRANSVAELAAARAVIPRMVQALLAAGVSAFDLTRITAETTDRLVRRALELAEADLGPPPLPYCWLGLGSEGRREQTLHTDQDHALVYADPTEEQAGAAAGYFLELAQVVVEALVRCGVPRCPGGVMASNPRWNAPLAVWRRQFSDWIHRPEPQALLNASIFFDLRAVGGEALQARTLRDQISREAPGGRRFLTLLASEALKFRPPLGFFRHLVVERSGEHRGALDIKRGGLQPIVDLARLHSLRRGLRQTNTVERLHALSEVGALPAEEATDLVAAYDFMLLLRVRSHTRQIAAGQETDNYVDPKGLSRADRTLLKEYFGVIANAQETIEEEFATHLLG